MNPFELLKADHEKVAKLFDQLEAGSGRAKLDTFKQIKQELELHTHVEETIFYPALESPRETHDLTLEAYEEHKVVKTLLRELARSRKADDEWQAKAKVLRENVEHHVEEEENELFDKASDALESDQLEALGDQMAAEKERKLGRTPSASGSKQKQSTAKTPGIISTIANFVGLGTKNAAKQAPGKAGKKSAKKSAKKTTKQSTRNTGEAAKKSGKAATKKGSKSSKASKKTSNRAKKASKKRASR